ncbi:undecaprenyl-diphosphatase [Haloferula luteola]|uniref:Undecaprenyl-diphosphatase n=1 Tax=Haloferula luteola TaxID=595692 RepID=A0A840V1E5_9BACT|nr:phosphatase PAP2 family protein [Haloferula luteola]MBB5351213.1 undecaprenyl-diphosphatase [Haloferula luteola]
MGAEISISGKVLRTWQWLRARWGVPMLAVVLLGGAFGFLEIAEEVGEAETRKVDETILLAMRQEGHADRPVGPEGLAEVARDITALGGATLLTLICLVAWGMTLFAGKRRLAWVGVGAVVVAMLVMKLLKLGYDRPRPDLVEHGTRVVSASFPSGHSMMSAVVYLTLGILVARTQPKRRVQAFVLAVSVGVTVAVGLSRVYLGVHWPTDVLAGWMLGGVWALAVWILAGVLEDRCRAEKKTTPGRGPS